MIKALIIMLSTYHESCYLHLNSTWHINWCSFFGFSPNTNYDKVKQNDRFLIVSRSVYEDNGDTWYPLWFSCISYFNFLNCFYVDKQKIINQCHSFVHSYWFSSWEKNIKFWWKLSKFSSFTFQCLSYFLNLFVL